MDAEHIIRFHVWTENFCSFFAPKVAFSNLSGIVWTRPKTDRPQHEAPGNNYRVCGVYSPEPRAEVYCFRLNFNISKLGYHQDVQKPPLPPEIGDNKSATHFTGHASQ